MKASSFLFRFLLLALLLGVCAAPLVAATKPATKTSAAPASPVDLNTGTQAQLEAVSGIGEATAKKIIAGRPYTSVDDLKKLNLPASQLEKIKPFLTVAPAPSKTTPAAAAAAPANAPAGSAPAAAPAPKTPQTPATHSSSAPTATFQPPPQQGMVWVNLNTKVYHYEGDPYYGRTKNGKYMTEADATKAGFRAAKKKTTTDKP